MARSSLYEVRNLKHAEIEMEEFKRFTFGTISFNMYDLHFLVNDHCTRVQHPWIHGACHWPQEDPWIYYYHFSRPNESIDIPVEWLEKHREATSQRGQSSIATESSRPVCDKRKIKVVDSTKEKQNCKFKENPLVLKEALEIKAKK